ncbi:hypothetical protein ABPG74_003756 [Tetrahymena malaccensis]
MLLDELNPFVFEKIFLDLELGIHNAVKKVFTHNYSIVGCFFHATKNMQQQQAGNLGLKTKSKIVDTKKVINPAKCMLHVPIKFRKEIWQKEDSINYYRKDISYKKYLEYLEQNNINQNSKFGRLSDYSLVKFNKGENYNRTTNICEGYHLRLQNRILKKKFRESYVIEKIQQETEFFYLRYHKILKGNKRVEREQDIFEFESNSFSKGSEKLLQYIKEKLLENNSWDLNQYHKIAKYFEQFDEDQIIYEVEDGENDVLSEHDSQDFQFEIIS